MSNKAKYFIEYIKLHKRKLDEEVAMRNKIQNAIISIEGLGIEAVNWLEDEIDDLRLLRNFAWERDQKSKERKARKNKPV